MKQLNTRLRSFYSRIDEHNPIGEIGLISLVFYALLYTLYFIDPLGTSRVFNFYMDRSWALLTLLVVVEILKTWDQSRAQEKRRKKNKELFD